MRKIVGCKLALLFIGLAFNSASLSQTAIITGTVRAGDEFLQGATISLGNKTTLTDGRGNFSLSIEPGNYTIIVSHVGYKKFEQTITIERGATKNFVFHMVSNEELDAVMVGSRSTLNRNNHSTPIPIDVFSSDGLIETGQISVTQMLNFLAPSFNTSREVLNETMTLRGLDPQHVLILVNNIRYHPMAWIFGGNLRGQLGRGSVGNDLNSIPFPAIEKIEILRDGAAAQYGSDAIGGVINIVLKKASDKTSIQTHGGQFYKNDGEKFFAGIYHGFSVNKKGFFGLSASFRNQRPTFRGGIYDGLVYRNYPSSATRDDSIRIKAQDELLVQSRDFNRKSSVDNVGNTKLGSLGVSMNGGLPINNHVETFWTILFNSRKLNRAALFRFPRDSNRVNFALFPDGFQQRNKSNTVDASAIVGVRGKTKNNWHWDISTAHGINSVKSHVTNTNNASQTFLLGANAPTSFYTGTDIFKQLTNNLNVTKQFKLLNFGYGVEWRLENYIVKTGEEAAWKNFDPVNYSQGGVGASGPENAINKTRNVLASYFEIENELISHLLLNVAARYEYYNDFGSNFAGKLAMRYKFSKSFMLKTSVNNGFRAPSLQQRHLVSIGESLMGPNRSVTINGLFPNDHEIIRALAIPKLRAEKSVNVSGGFVADFFKNIHFSADAYLLEIRNRIVLSGNFDRRPNNTIDKILDAHPDFDRIMRISFFANSINTITKGIDIAVDRNWKNKNTCFGITVTANFNSTKLFGPIKTSDRLAQDVQSQNTLFNSEERTKLEKGQPASKIILLTKYENGGTKLIIRTTRFGKTSIAPLSGIPEFFSSKILTDISFIYSPSHWLAVTLGANNIMNTYPDRLNHYTNTSQGSWIYSPEASPFGFNGGYYFINLNFDLAPKNKKASQ
jgi:iron complex outermembrane receptor protein